MVHTATDITTKERSSDRRALLALYAATAAVFADMYLTQPLLPVLGREFGVPPATAGLTISAVVLMIALASSSYGPLGDAWGRKPVMVWSCALLAIPTLLCAVAPSLAVLVLLRGLQGLFVPGLTAVAVAYIGDRAPETSIGTAVGGYIGATVMGGLIGRVLSGFVADALHWRWAFVVFAAITIITALLLARVLPHDGARREATHWRAAYRSMWGHWRHRQLVGAFLIGGALFFAFNGVFTFLPYYLSGAPFQLSTSLVSSVYFAYLAGVIVSPLAGRLSARVPRRTIMAGGMLVAALGIAGSLVHSLPLIVLSLVVLVGGNFTAQATTPAFVNTTARSAKGGASALYLTCYYIGGALGSVLPGLAWQAAGWPGVVLTCLMAVGVGLLANWLLCRPG
jgi:YNFM family putative membrane transporter